MLDPHALGLEPLFSTIRDGLVVADAETGRIELWNDGAEAIFGYTAEEACAMTVAQAVVPERMRRWHSEGLARYGETGHGPLIESEQPVELPALRKDGVEITVELTLSALTSANVPGRYAVAVIRDVTHRKREEQDLRSGLARAEAALEIERRRGSEGVPGGQAGSGRSLNAG